MSTVIKMECDDCSTGKFVEKETISHIREKVEHPSEYLVCCLKTDFCSRWNSVTARRPHFLLSSMSSAQQGLMSSLKKCILIFSNFLHCVRFVNYESSKSPSHLPFLPLIIATTGLVAMLR